MAKSFIVKYVSGNSARGVKINTGSPRVAERIFKKKYPKKEILDINQNW